MLKTTVKIGLFLLGSILAGCFEQETFTDEPEIALKGIAFIDSPNDADSILIEFSFTDENGDLGLKPDDVLKPYQLFDAVLDSRDSFVTISGKDYVPPFFSSPVTTGVGEDGGLIYIYFPELIEPFSEEDLRPDFYTCEDYQRINSDTFFVSRNEFYYNVHLTFEQQQGDSFVPIDFKAIFNSSDCDLGNFNARLPFFDPDGRVGTIKYSLISRAFSLAFQNNVIRLRLYVYDRALNKSNEVVSNPFRLREITL